MRKAGSPRKERCHRLKGGGPDLQGDGVIAERAGRIDPAPRAGVLGVEAVGDALGEGSDRDLPCADGESVLPWCTTPLRAESLP